jgi:ferredoxin-type protein NapG
VKRRSFLKIITFGLSSIALAPKSVSCKILQSPLTTNRLRPPGAVLEEIFPAKCIRCGRCVEVCPYHSIKMLDIRSGIHAGTPLMEVEKIPCYLCMKCVDVCPTGSLQRIRQEDSRIGLAVIDRFTCLAWEGTILCRTCYDKCPFPEKAIRLVELKPIIDEAHCTGCGLCTNACPFTAKDGKKAVNVEPVYSRDKVTG